MGDCDDGGVGGRWRQRICPRVSAGPASSCSSSPRGIDQRPLVPDPEVPRFLGRMELEWPIDTLEPLSFVLARLLDPLATALERADRGAVALRLDLRLVDRTMFTRMLPLPAPMRDPRVLRTLLLLDLESHPPPAAIDIVTLEIDPAPGRVVQYSLLERALPSVETLTTLTARLGALVGESRCGAPALVDTHRPDGFEMQRFDPAPSRGVSVHPFVSASASGPTRVVPVLRRFRPPVPVRVTVERGRPIRVAIDRRGMPGGQVIQAAGPWRTSGAWWDRPTSWARDEWDVAMKRRDGLSVTGRRGAVVDGRNHRLMQRTADSGQPSFSSPSCIASFIPPPRFPSSTARRCPRCWWTARRSSGIRRSRCSIVMASTGFHGFIWRRSESG